MKTQFMKFILAAGFALALAFTFSCSSNDDGGGEQLSSSSGAEVSSSSNGGSSSVLNSSSSNNTEVSSSSGSDGKGNDIANYRTVLIGTQTWMAENLNYAVEGSKCYDDSEANCDKYGRLYDWSTANTVCPSGWHLPNNADWDKLLRSVDGTSDTESPYESPTAGRYLKATSGWSNCGTSDSDNSYLCEDSYEFSALPGGYGYPGGYFLNVGEEGYWWSASELSSNFVYRRNMGNSDEGIGWFLDDRSFLYSVRCVQD